MDASSNSRRGMTTRSTPWRARKGDERRNISRINRLARLRSTAPPSLRDATMPRRQGFPPLAAVMSVRNRP